MSDATPTTSTVQRQFVSFLVAGGIAALVNLASRYVLDIWIGYRPAIVIAYLCGMATAFVLTRRYVFSGTETSVRSSAAWFAFVNVLAVTQTLLVSVGLAEVVFPAVDMTWHPHDLAHVAGVVVPVATSFIGHRHLSFKVAGETA